MSRYAILVLLFVLAVPPLANADPTSDLDLLRGAWHDCLRQKVERLDDGVSPASDIAVAVATSGYCRVEYDGMHKPLKFTPAMLQMVEQDREKMTMQVALTLTLAVRAERRTESNMRMTK